MADAHHLFRHGLRDLLFEAGLRVVGESADGEGAIRLVGRTAPDVLVVDLDLPRRGGIEVIERVSKDYPATNIMVLTVTGDPDTIIRAIEAGACGYLFKDASVEALIEGVSSTASGKALVPLSMAIRMLNRSRLSPDDHQRRAAMGTLTSREAEVLALVVQGRGNAEIADALVISPPTVKNHVSSILTKLQVDNRIQAAVAAVRSGLV